MSQLRLQRLTKGQDPYTGMRIGDMLKLPCDDEYMASAVGSVCSWREVLQGYADLDAEESDNERDTSLISRYELCHVIWKEKLPPRNSPRRAVS